MGGKTYLVGVGMSRFVKPGSQDGKDYPDFAKVAGERALADACISYEDVDQAVLSYCYGESTSGQVPSIQSLSRALSHCSPFECPEDLCS